MKLKLIIFFASCYIMSSCNKVIDQYPASNLNTGTFYSNFPELNAGLTGTYRGMQAPLFNEWALTELRSDNSKQGQTGSSSTPNVSLNQLDMFTVNSYENRVFEYWQSTYTNIRNANIVIDKLGVNYDPVAGVTSFTPSIDIPILEADRKQLAGEALFIRAYHYFNLVRLYGGVFLVHEVIGPDEALLLNRSSVDETYKLIEADLKTAMENMRNVKYNQVPATERGRATIWAAKTLLAKVYLTNNKKSEALTLLNDVRLNSGHALVTAPGAAGNPFSNVFSTANELNEEIIFAVRYKAGGLGLGSRFANLFGPLNTGSAVVPGDGQGLNYPTADLDSTMKVTDGRKAITLARHVSGTTTKLYTRKYTTTVSNDGESDWPVLRFSDVLLMIAEAEGNTGNSIAMINLVRSRAGVVAIDPSGITSTELFEDTLAHERRMEFAFENHRWFDLVRYGKTTTTINAVDVIKAHFEKEFPVHYANYPQPAQSLEQLKANVIPERLLLPIPQKEFDVNPRLHGQQNPGYQ